jgi:hypothetical protein
MFVLSYRAALDCGWFVLGGADFGATLDDYPQPQLTPEWKIRVLSGPHAALPRSDCAWRMAHSP